MRKTNMPCCYNGLINKEMYLSSTLRMFAPPKNKKSLCDTNHRALEKLIRVKYIECKY